MRPALTTRQNRPDGKSESAVRNGSRSKLLKNNNNARIQTGPVIASLVETLRNKVTATMNSQSFQTPEDIRQLAYTLVDRHGAKAIGYADLAVGEMEEMGDDSRADAWRALKSVVEDALAGRLDRDGGITLH